MSPEIKLPGTVSGSARGRSPIVDVRDLAIPRKAISEYERAIKDLENDEANRSLALETRRQLNEILSSEAAR